MRAIQQKVDTLDEAFLYSEAIDATTYGRQRDKLREELTLAKIDHHATPSTNSTSRHPGVRGAHPAARVRPVGAVLARSQAAAAASVLSGRNRVRRKAVQSNRRNGTTFQCLAPSESADEKMVSRAGIEPATRRLRVRLGGVRWMPPLHFAWEIRWFGVR